jgi:hypothetical protein
VYGDAEVPPPVGRAGAPGEAGAHSDERGGGLARLTRLMRQARSVADLAGL